VSATRSALGVAALWATLCVVLLAAGWLSGARASVPLAPPAVALSVLALAPVDAAATLPQAPAPCPEPPASEQAAATEGGADPDTSAAGVTLRLRRAAWVAVVPLWPADALRWQRMEPSLRLNPGHAPPYA
jgi:hypothetical protein